MKLSTLRYIVSVLAVSGIIFISSCTQKANQTFVKTSGQPVIKGVSLSPKSFQQNDFTDFFKKTQQTGSIVSWAGDWNELNNTQSGGPAVLASLAAAYSYTPIIEAQFFTQSTGRLLRPLDKSVKQNYKDSAIAFAVKYKPKYIGFGIEINMLYDKSPNDFKSFVYLFDDVYDAVKSKSPNTKVFTIFQLEKMKGMNGGLFGGKNDPSKTQWQLLGKFPKSDIVAFTTYPGLIYKDPSEIPQNYYTEIKLHTTKPVAFTEIGWHSAPSPAGWESSYKEQAEFVAIFFDLTEDLNGEFAVWSFMYDQNTIKPFNSMGLRNNDGTARPAFDEWVAVK